MLFTTDRQTLEDLNIFGKNGGNGISDIFNRCATRGGAAILEEMFRYPLSEDEAINKRSGIIRYFMERAAEFPFQVGYLDAAEAYLANTDERTRLTGQNYSLTHKLGNIIAVDADTQLLHKGIQALSELLRGMYETISSLVIPDNHPYAQEHGAIKGILLKPSLTALLESKSKLTNELMSELDVIFRFKNRDDIQKLLAHIYHLDVYISIAKVASARGFVFAKALPSGQHKVILEGVYHPQLKNAVPNNIQISPENNVIFLTGANMAGKSTFMKSLSIALFLAHMGFPVAAKKMEFAVLDGIYTTINLPDNLGMGTSHFYAEVLRVKKMAQELSSGKNLFILFDELFRGTNVKDAYQATIMITKGFARKLNSIFVISTHIIEAAAELKVACPNICFVYLPTKMNGSHPIYSYKLEQGVTDDRHGMLIINNEGIMDILNNGKKKI